MDSNLLLGWLEVKKVKNEGKKDSVVLKAATERAEMKEKQEKDNLVNQTFLMIPSIDHCRILMNLNVPPSNYISLQS